VRDALIIGGIAFVIGSGIAIATAPSADVDFAAVPVATTVLPHDTAPVPIVDHREGTPWGDAVSGVLTFRGNPTRTFYGTGPVPAGPTIGWRFPDRAMCSLSTDPDGEREWCGTGWTGQPAVFERDGRTWVVFGAYDRAVHFLDASTGARLLPDLPTGDIIKGSVTVDPDGYPLVYSGSRDGHYRVIAIDGDAPRVLWDLPATAVHPTLWNDDWDGAGLVIDDFLLEGGENSQLHVVRLHRGYDANGSVTVAPELVWHTPGWDRQLLHDLGDSNVSIESSVAWHDGTVWFTNSGGLVQGWHLGTPPMSAMPTRVFRYWVGDDTDATVVVGDEGDLYVAAEWDRGTERAAEVGQLLRLDPSRPDHPVVWSLADQGDREEHGFWATPALHGDVVIAPTTGGRVLGVDRATGAVRWELHLPGPVWQSPVVVDDVLLQGDCHGDLHAYDVHDTTREPAELWSLHLGGCIESTPTVWAGSIYVGTRAGQLVMSRD
jgi:outer membrane protein assembly factor BamB